jgi:hypothetical protein
MKIYLDFDGTVVEHFYPLIGAYNPGAIEVLYLLQAKGYELILNTYRSEIKDSSLNEALHYINQLPLFKKITQTTTYKISNGMCVKPSNLTNYLLMILLQICL